MFSYVCMLGEARSKEERQREVEERMGWRGKEEGARRGKR